ncbi:hypothetical protein C8R44DRAFT_749725 [Mycena epipterygia]|nr:hypothetical protein C8R44DRAFT_749725 [Mycena epipterygia]
MAFTLSSKNIRIRGATLSADCRFTSNGTDQWVASSLDLDRYIRNQDGKFVALDSDWVGFIASARNTTVNKSLLKADLRNQAGTYVKAFIDLNLFVGNDNGRLSFKYLHQLIGTSTASLDLTGSVLTVLLLNSDGRLHPREMNLNCYYANDAGRFRGNGTGFYPTARNVRLGTETAAAIFTLKAELLQSGSTYVPAEANLGVDIWNSYGNLRFVGSVSPPPATFWDLFLKFFEGAPVVGFIVGGIRALMGNSEDAQRAISLSANSTIVMVGIAIGTSLGGPLGAAIGAAVVTPIGIFVETSLSPDRQTATIERYIYETLRNTVAAGVGAHLNNWVTRNDSKTLRAVFAAINDAFGGFISWAVVEGIDVAIYASLKLIINVLKGELPMPPEWLEVEAMVAALVDVWSFQNSQNCTHPMV